MKWRIMLTRRFVKELRKQGIYDKIIGFLSDLISRPDFVRLLSREKVVLELTYNGEYKVRRIRIGSWRLFYIIKRDTKEIVFFDVRPRKKAYNK